MKIRIIDLMDNYSGKGIKLESPESMLWKNNEFKPNIELSVPKRCGHRLSLIAASLVLMVTACCFGLMTLSRASSGNALNEDSIPGSSIETFESVVSPKKEMMEQELDTRSAKINNDSATEENTTWSNSIILTSSYYPIELEVPTEYAEEVIIDVPFLEPTHDLYYSNAVFIFHDRTSLAYDMTGLVWCIIATPKEEYNAIIDSNESCIFMFNQTLLGSDGTYVYELIHPDTSGQYNLEDDANAQSYYEHICTGQDILEQFIQLNTITSDWTWIERYENCTINILKKNMQLD